MKPAASGISKVFDTRRDIFRGVLLERSTKSVISLGFSLLYPNYVLITELLYKKCKILGYVP